MTKNFMNKTNNKPWLSEEDASSGVYQYTIPTAPPSGMDHVYTTLQATEANEVDGVGITIEPLVVTIEPTPDDPVVMIDDGNIDVTVGGKDSLPPEWQAVVNSHVIAPLQGNNNPGIEYPLPDSDFKQPVVYPLPDSDFVQPTPIGTDGDPVVVIDDGNIGITVGGKDSLPPEWQRVVYGDGEVELPKYPLPDSDFKQPVIYPLPDSDFVQPTPIGTDGDPMVVIDDGNIGVIVGGSDSLPPEWQQVIESRANEEPAPVTPILTDLPIACIDFPGIEYPLPDGDFKQPVVYPLPDDGFVQPDVKETLVLADMLGDTHTDSLHQYLPEITPKTDVVPPPQVCSGYPVYEPSVDHQHVADQNQQLIQDLLQNKSIIS